MQEQARFVHVGFVPIVLEAEQHGCPRSSEPYASDEIDFATVQEAEHFPYFDIQFDSGTKSHLDIFIR
jgi:hypothetical protein